MWGNVTCQRSEMYPQILPQTLKLPPFGEWSGEGKSSRKLPCFPDLRARRFLGRSKTTCPCLSPSL